VTKTLKPFQEEDVRFLMRRPGGNGIRYLANDPGLGKTPVACTAIKRLKAKRGLIVCLDQPPVKAHWINHLVEWAGVDPADIYVVQSLSDTIPDAPWIIVGFSQMIDARILAQLKQRIHAVLIIDEAHKCKGLRTARTKAVMGNKGDNLKARAYYVWYISGTPVPNRPIESYPLLVTSIPEKLGKYKDFINFGQHFCAGWLDDQRFYHFEGSSNEDELAQILADADFMRRRTIDSVYTELPPVIQTPMLFDIDDLGCDEHDTPTPTLRRILGVAKSHAVIDYLRERLTALDKLVIVAYHQEAIENLVERLQVFNPVALYGPMGKREKEFAFQEFTTNPNCKVFIIQIKAGGAALDGLQRVCHNMFILEPDWSAGDWHQMLGRLRRMGQERVVNATIAVTVNTLDGPILGSKGYKERTTKQVLSLVTDKGVTLMAEGLQERQVAALESIAESLKGILKVQATNPGIESTKESKTEKADSKAESKNGKAAESKAEKLTHDDVRAVAELAIKSLVENTGVNQGEATALVSSVVKNIGGADKLADVKEAKLAAVKAGIEKIVEEAQPSAASMI